MGSQRAYQCSKFNMKVFLVSTLASLAMAMPGEINNVNRVSGFLNPSWVGAWPDSAVEVAYPSHTASWPGATVSVTRGKRSPGGFTVEGNTNQVSGSSPFPIYNAAWPGATVSVTHGKKKRSAPLSIMSTESAVHLHSQSTLLPGLEQPSASLTARRSDLPLL